LIATSSSARHSGSAAAISRAASSKVRKQNERGGFDCDAQELLEVSIVTIPENSRALRAKSLDGEGDDIVERIAQRVVELLDERESEGPRRRARQA